ncbi:MAG: hypothetical protein WCJ80_14250 [Bacteroidota bacterium]|jgi:hypothetical protein
MRKIILVFLIGIMVIIGFGVFVAFKIASNTNISINVNDNDEEYQVEASYGRAQSRRVLSYIDAQLSKSKQFRHARMDGDVELDDHTKLYIKTMPGRLIIKVNKNDNDSAGVERIRELTEGIKVRLTENN